MTDDFLKLPREQRLARVLYSHLTDADTQRQMAEIAKREGKQPPGTQGPVAGGVAQPLQRRK
jgi:hypothetical protein